MCLWAWKIFWSIVESLKVYTYKKLMFNNNDTGMIIICIGDHDKKDPADMIDKAIKQLNLPGNSVGQSAATSQGECLL